MNFIKIQLCVLFCAVSAFAQFDKLRGFAYGRSGTLGAAPTIADLVAKPNMIYGNKFAYVLPTNYLGYSAFDIAGGTALLGFENDIYLGLEEPALGRIIVGYARNTWGLSLDINVNTRLSGRDEKYSYDEMWDYNNNIGLKFSMPLGNYIFYSGAKFGFDTEYNAPDELGYNERSAEYNSKEAYIGLTGGEKFIWVLLFRLARSYGETQEDGYDYETEGVSTATMTTLNYNISYKVLENNRARLMVGLNNRFDWNYSDYDIKYEQFYSSEVTSYGDGTYFLQLNIYPNIFGEVVITDNLFAFVGAAHNFYIRDYYGKDLTIANSSSGSYVGLRYGHKHWAIETMLANDIFESIKEKVNPLINLGGFIYF